MFRRFSLILSIALMLSSSFIQAGPPKHFKAGFNVPTNWEKTVKWAPRRLQGAKLPETFDCRAQGWISPIKDQGNCGSCWAFSMTKVVESAILHKNGGAAPDLAEQWLVDGNPWKWGVNGGWFDFGLWIVTKDKSGLNGAVLERDDPYKAAAGKCRAFPHYWHLASWAFIPTDRNGKPDVNQIKQAIYEHGPISAAVYVGPKFQAYTGGTFARSETRNPDNCNHAIVLAGWRDTTVRGKTTTAWLLANSWDTGWGEGGFMWIRAGTSNVGYAACAVDFEGAGPVPAVPQ
jgi:C1A family cysteine protease